MVAIADRKGGDFTGKPRPAVIVQSDHFANLPSVLICPITGTEIAPNLLRLPVQSCEALRLAKPSWVEVEKLTAVRRSRVGEVIGRLSEAELAALTRRLIVLIGAA